MSVIPHHIRADGTVLTLKAGTQPEEVTFKIDMRHYPHVAEAWAAFKTCDVTRNEAIHEAYRHLMNAISKTLPDLVGSL